ncbi:hypothetical protein GQ44DRAFT_75257 [Phaeosphaeriaceae sp. PMI808]|nr:hypothetical protein GQ44DRAFT_75257 [Phaeosphaeriaceae sp. PMI808]
MLVLEFNICTVIHHSSVVQCTPVVEFEVLQYKFFRIQGAVNYDNDTCNAARLDSGKEKKWLNWFMYTGVDSVACPIIVVKVVNKDPRSGFPAIICRVSFDRTGVRRRRNLCAPDGSDMACQGGVLETSQRRRSDPRSEQSEGPTILCVQIGTVTGWGNISPSSDREIRTKG